MACVGCIKKDRFRGLFVEERTGTRIAPRPASMRNMRPYTGNNDQRYPWSLFSGGMRNYTFVLDSVNPTYH